MIQNVPGVDTSAVTLAPLDVVKESKEALAGTLSGAEALVIALGFVPGNPLEMNKAAKAVDNVVTIAFGGVLDEKLVAEKYLRASGLDYTIVRPGGLKATAPSGALVVKGENTLNSGEISRDTVAEVCVKAVFDTQ